MSHEGKTPETCKKSMSFSLPKGYDCAVNGTITRERRLLQKPPPNSANSRIAVCTVQHSHLCGGTAFIHPRCAVPANTAPPYSLRGVFPLAPSLTTSLVILLRNNPRACDDPNKKLDAAFDQTTHHRHISGGPDTFGAPDARQKSE